MTPAKRIADLVFKVSFDKDTRELEKLLQVQGATLRKVDGALFINKANYSTGIMLGCDPITALSVIIMALWGQLGMLLPEAKEAFKIVNKQWGERVKANKKKQVVVTNENSVIETEQIELFS